MDFPESWLGRVVKRQFIKIKAENPDYDTGIKLLSKTLVNIQRRVGYWNFPNTSLSQGFFELMSKVSIRDQELAFIRLNGRIPRTLEMDYDFDRTFKDIEHLPIEKRHEVWGMEYDEFKIFVNYKPSNEPFHLQKVRSEHNRLESLLNYSHSQTQERAMTNQTPKNMKESPLRWKGQVNQLCAVFFNLYEKGYINSSRAELERWILDSFRDNSGSELKESTINTGLRPDKPDKRNKDGFFEAENLTQFPLED